MRPIFWVLIVLFILILLLISNLLKLKDNFSLNPAEQKLAMEHDGTDAFYRQIIASTGEWKENVGSPIFDNQYVASLPPKIAGVDASM